MWKLSSKDIRSPHALKSLQRANIRYVSDILDCAGMDIQGFFRMEPGDVVAQLCSECEDLSNFGQESKVVLADFLRRDRSKIMEHYFLEISKLRYAHDDEGDDEDFMPDLGSALPRETLLVGVTILKGDVDFVCIEEVILEIESELSDSEISGDMRDLLRDVFSTDEWPAEKPIYVSEHAAVVYPDLLVSLYKHAVLILK